MENSPISLLMFGTIAVALVIAIVLALRFFRKPENRHPMEGDRERNIGQVIDEKKDA